MLTAAFLAFIVFAGIRSFIPGPDSTTETGGHVLEDFFSDSFGSTESSSFSSSSFSSSSSNNNSSVAGSSQLPSCKTVPSVSTFGRVIGDISAWVCFICYFIGRVPQIIMNYKRQATEGLSFLMFFLAIVANVCYGTSIVIMPIDTSSGVFWEATLPYILGSYGCILPSLVVLYQFFKYRKGKKHYFNIPGVDPNEIVEPDTVSKE